jgi:[ribosomal protein S5]-alanine N-acetyltransferase
MIPGENFKKPQLNTIETTRLMLKEITPKLYDILFQSYDDDTIKEVLGLITDDELNTARDRFTQGMTTYHQSFVNFLMLEKDTNEIIGRCGFHTWYLMHGRAEIGYAIHNDHNKGKGFMKEALAAIVDYGFNTMDLHRSEAFIGSTNVASLKLVSSLGFTKEGCLRQHYSRNGKFEDSEVYSLLRSEYGQ